MRATGIGTPAAIGLTLSVLLAGLCTPARSAPGYTPLVEYSQSALPDEKESRALLTQFRQVLNAEPYYLEFELHAFPRKGDERTYRGRLWGGRGDRGPITRISLVGAAGHEERLLVQSGPHACIWSWSGTGTASLDPEALLSPLIPGLEMTAFDLQMPYLYWPDARVMSVERIRGRPAYGFLFKPPADFAAAHPGIAGVRAFLDTQYNALVQSELVAPNGQVTKTLSLLDLKRVGDRWTVKEVDVRNEETRDKTRFSATAAALGAHWDASLFEPGHLASPAAIPSADKIIPFGP